MKYCFYDSSLIKAPNHQDHSNVTRVLESIEKNFCKNDEESKVKVVSFLHHDIFF